MNEKEWMKVAEAVQVRRMSEDALFEMGISGPLSFYVYVPGLKMCRVPVVALQHFKAGADEYPASGMPQRYGIKLSGPWLVKRAQLRLERSTDHDIQRLLNNPEDALLEQGISGGLPLYVDIPGLELCRVPVVALQHLKAGADAYTASGMPQMDGCKLSGPWLVKRALLRITDHDKERLLNPPATEQRTVPADAVPVESEGSHIRKKWTPDRLAEARAYRAKHGTKKAAEYFKVSESRIRELLPSGLPKKPTYPVRVWPQVLTRKG